MINKDLQEVKKILAAEGATFDRYEDKRNGSCVYFAGSDGKPRSVLVQGQFYKTPRGPQNVRASIRQELAKNADTIKITDLTPALLMDRVGSMLRGIGGKRMSAADIASALELPVFAIDHVMKNAPMRKARDILMEGDKWWIDPPSDADIDTPDLPHLPDNLTLGDVMRRIMHVEQLLVRICQELGIN